MIIMRMVVFSSVQLQACNGISSLIEQMGSALPPPRPFSRVPEPSSILPHPIFQFIINAASLRLRRRLSAGSLHQSSFKRVPFLISSERTFALKGIEVLGVCKDALESSCSLCLSVFDGGLSRNGSGDDNSMVGPSRRKSLVRRNWTNVLLAINVLAYVAQVATQGKVLLWGAKINSLIDKGQIWRLATSSVLHANIGHLLVNCFSLNSVGPTVENISGPRRYLAIYLTSAIASTATSYWLCKAPAVGASGAIFGLVGSVAVFILRHRGFVKDSEEDLQRIAQVILVNMAIGAMSRRIDNWGHLGGLLGGVAVSWLLGPAWKYDSMSMDGRRVFTDRAPIFLLRRGEGGTRRNP